MSIVRNKPLFTTNTLVMGVVRVVVNGKRMNNMYLIRRVSDDRCLRGLFECINTERQAQRILKQWNDLWPDHEAYIDRSHVEKKLKKDKKVVDTV